MIEDWLDIEEAEHGERKHLYVLAEKEGGRAVVQADLIERVRAHYDDPRRIADDIAELGFPGAATILRERLPTDARTRSGEVGEILATEFMEHQTGFEIFAKQYTSYQNTKEQEQQPELSQEFTPPGTGSSTPYKQTKSQTTSMPDTVLSRRTGRG